MTFRATPASADISDTGLPVPRGIDMRLFSLADSTGLQVPSSAWDIPPAVFQQADPGPMQMAAAPASIGHNSKAAQRPKDDGDKALGVETAGLKRSSWYTPSEISFEEAAKALIGSGRYAQERRALIEAIFDPRLGVAPLPLQLLAAVVECINGGTGMAHPGTKYLAQRIADYVNGLPAEDRIDAIDNAAALVRQCGYSITKKRAPERGGSAITHYTITCPPPEVKAAAIDSFLRWRAQEAAKRRRSTAPRANPIAAMGSVNPITPMGSGVNPIAAMGSEGGQSHRGDAADPMGAMEKRPPLSITEPGKKNPKTLSSANADGACATENLFSAGVPDQGRAPSEGAAHADGATPAEPSSPKAPKWRGAKAPPSLPAAVLAAQDAYNEVAARHKLVRCMSMPPKRAQRLEQRIVDLGGLEMFKLALTALALPAKPNSLVDFITRIKTDTDLDYLMQTDGKSGDVLARLLDVAASQAGSASSGAKSVASLQPNWWQRPAAEKIARAYTTEDWRQFIRTYCRGAWNREMCGPAKGERGCLVPDAITIAEINKLMKGDIP